MTTLGIIGGGRAATVHAESVRALPGVRLIGIGRRQPGRGSGAAEALGCAELSVAETIERADMLVVAVPPVEVAGVLAQIPLEQPLIVESPLGVDSASDPGDRPKAMLGANLLHAPVVRRGLAAINDLGELLHLLLRSTAPRAAWHGPDGGRNGVSLDLGGRLLPVLLAAAARPVLEVSAGLDYRHGAAVRAELDLRTADGPLLRAELQWDSGPASANLEAASAGGAVSLDLWPLPVLEVDGAEVVSAHRCQALHALGFVSQLRRLAAVAADRAEPWPDLAGGVGALRIIEAAALSARSGRPQSLR